MTSVGRLHSRSIVSVVIFVGFAAAFRGLVSLSGHHGSAVAEVEDAFFSPAGGSPWLIYLIVIWFAFRRWGRLRASLGDPPKLMLASTSFLVSVLLIAWAHYVSASVLLVPAMSLLLLGSAALMGGAEAVRAMRLPALFLLLAMPIPAVVLNSVMYPLQVTTAEVTTMILRAFGGDATTSGELIRFRGVTFQVIESCSGLRTASTLVMTAFVYGEALDRSRQRIACLVLLSPVIGLFINELRVLSIVLNPFSEIASIHTLQGIVMIVAGVLVLAAVDGGLGHLFPNRLDRRDRSILGARGSEDSRQVVLLAISVGLAAYTLLVAPWEAPRDTAPQVSSFPGIWRGWVERGRLPIDREFLGSVGYDQCMLRKYQRGSAQTEIMMCADRRLNGGNRMLSEKMWRPGPGWETERSGRTEIVPSLPPVDFRVLRRGKELQLVVFWEIGVESRVVEMLRGLLWLDRGPFFRHDRSVVVRVGTEIEGGVTSLKSAHTRLIEFVNDFREPFIDVGAI